eukprot:4232538-Pleurochrysis_carterae.AAC.1
MVARVKAASCTMTVCAVNVAVEAPSEVAAPSEAEMAYPCKIAVLSEISAPFNAAVPLDAATAARVAFVHL